MCEVLNWTCVYKGAPMYSKEFMKFLYDYQKDDFKQKESESREIRFKNNRSGKLAEILLTVKIK